MFKSIGSPTADPGISRLIPAWSHNFLEIDHEIISMVILLFPLIQEGLLSVTSESMCTKYWLSKGKVFTSQASKVSLIPGLYIENTKSFDIEFTRQGFERAC